jgi:hypothetical protein
MNMTNEQSRDIVAKLLAEENISIIRSNVRTASFDTNARVLSLPVWKDTTTETEEMLIAHEVGHALFTPKLEREQFADVPFGYMNVLEDVRIEKLMKRRFPGLRRIMFMGYKQLNEKDFFGIKNRDLSKLRLIDRINLWYKAGVNSGVKFTEEERDFLYRAEHTESFDEVMALAVDVFNYQKAQTEKRKQMLDEIFKEDITLDAAEDLSFDEEYEYDDFGDDEEEEEDNSFKTESNNEDEPEEEMAGDDSIAPMQPLEHQNFDQLAAQDAENQVETMDNFNQRLDELADSDTVYDCIDFAYCKEYNPIVGYKKILKQIRVFEPGSFHTRYDDEKKPIFTDKDFVQFRAESMRVVNYLVKEFEMRKSAKQYKRATQSKTGMLDPAKLFGYKISEDLFKRITVVPGGKNHGMVFLLDWSGSMHECIFDTVKQVINLAMFCHRVQIPFHVFAFSSGTSDLQDDEAMVQKFHEWSKMQYQARYNRKDNDPRQTAYDSFALLEFFNHRMNATEFNMMAKYLMSFMKFVTNYYAQWNDIDQITYEETSARAKVTSALGLGSTPLNEALVYMVHEFVPKFIKQNSIEKFTFMTLSDGDGHNIIDTNRFSYDSNTGKRRKIVSFLRDNVTKINHRLRTGESSEVTAVLNQMLRDRYNATTIGFFITSSRRRDIQYAVRTNCPDAWGTEDAIRTSMRKEGVACLKAAGRDEFFLMMANKTEILDEEIKVDSSMNSRAAAKAMTQFFNQQKTSRVLLNRFVGLTA